MSYSKHPSPLVIFFFIVLTITTLSFKLAAQISNDVKNNLKIPASDQTQIITTKDKSTLIGRIVKIGEKEIQFLTEYGEITIPLQKIKSIEIVSSSSIKSGKYWFPNPVYSSQQHL